MTAVAQEGLWEVVAADCRRYGGCNRPGSVIRLMFNRPAFACIFVLRLMQSAAARGHARRAAALRWINLVVFGADFVPGCAIGPGLLLLHTTGIVVGKGAVVGSACTLLHNTTLGEKRVDGGGDHRYPLVGDHVTIGVGATVLGAVEVEDGVTIRAGSLIVGE